MDAGNIRNHWFPIAIAANIAPSTVHSIQLFDEPLCLFRTVSGALCILSDRCLHRAEPLSLGRVEGEALESAFHGWQYSITGHVIRMPSVSNETCAKFQLRAMAYPVQEKYDRIWIWPGDPALAETMPIPTHVDAIDAEWTKVLDQECVINGVPIQLVCENMSDLAHAPFAHHGIAVNRTDAHAFSVETVEKKVEESTMAFQSFADLPEIGMSFEGVFYAPCHLQLIESLKGKKAFLKRFEIVPLTKTKTYMVLTTYIHKEHVLLNLAMKIPGMKWLLGYAANKVLDQDIQILCAQAKRVELGIQSMNNNLPSDSFSLAIGTWINSALRDEDSVTRVQQDSQYQAVFHGPWFQKWEQVDVPATKDIYRLNEE
jgi:chlorophyllide a oxygenase